MKQTSLKVQLDDGIHAAEVIYQNRKTISLAVGPEGELIVKSPLRLTEADILSFINSRRKWISRRLGTIAKTKEAGVGTLEPGRILFFKGKEYMLERAGSEISVKGGSIFLPAGMDMDELERWYSARSRDMVSEFIDNNRIPSCTIKVRKQKRIWGSCNTGRRIYINGRISMCRPSAFEYIMWHEICHLKHMDHSIGFYRELGKVFPAYKAERKWLSENEPYLRF